MTTFADFAGKMHLSCSCYYGFFGFFSCKNPPLHDCANPAGAKICNVQHGKVCFFFYFSVVLYGFSPVIHLDCFWPLNKVLGFRRFSMCVNWQVLYLNRCTFWIVQYLNKTATFLENVTIWFEQKPICSYFLKPQSRQTGFVCKWNKTQRGWAIFKWNANWDWSVVCDEIISVRHKRIKANTKTEAQNPLASSAIH
jgi:hypothetical protein